MILKSPKIPIELAVAAQMHDRCALLGRCVAGIAKQFTTPLLAGAAAVAPAAAGVRAVTAIVDRIHTNRYQPRSLYDDDDNADT